MIWHILFQGTKGELGPAGPAGPSGPQVCHFILNIPDPPIAHKIT